jgi:carboxyl-terminal processing protease
MAAVLVAGAAGCTQTAKHASGAASPSGQPPPCSANPLTAPLKPTTITTIGQAYYCVFAHYYAGPVLDDRLLLAAAFAGFTQELDRLGMDRPDATMPALTSHRPKDWTAFAAVYQKVTSQVPPRPAQRHALAAATITGMIASLHDNHARWVYPPPPPPGEEPVGLGMMTSPAYDLTVTAPQEALPPLFVTAVAPGSPAARHRVRPGDVIISVNGAPPFTGGVVSEGVMNLLFAPGPQASRVTVRLQRPATGRTWAVTLAPRPTQPLLGYPRRCWMGTSPTCSYSGSSPARPTRCCRRSRT